MTPMTGGWQSAQKDGGSGGDFRQGRRLGRHLPETLQVQVALGQVPGGGYGPDGGGVFLGGHQSHVAFGKDLALEARDGPQHRDAAIGFDGLADDGFVARAGDLVEDDPPDGHLGVEVLAAQHHGGGGAGPHGAVHHQHHRSGQKFGQLRGAVGALGVEAVVEAPVAFDQEGIRLGGMAGHRSQNLVPLHEEGVQIVAGASRRQAVPGRVDIVGALFKRHRLDAPGPARRPEAPTSRWSCRPRPGELPAAAGDRADALVLGSPFFVGNFDEAPAEVGIDAAAAVNEILDRELDIVLGLIRMLFEHGLLDVHGLQLLFALGFFNHLEDEFHQLFFG